MKDLLFGQNMKKMSIQITIPPFLDHIGEMDSGDTRVAIR